MTTVADIMSKNPVKAGMDAPLEDVVSLMKKKVVGSVIITEDNRPIGVVTERELLRELATKKEISPDIKAGDIMSRSITQVSPEASIEEAAKIMISKKSRLVVAKEGQLVGVVTASDLVKAFSQGKKDVSLGSIVSPKVKTLDVENTVFEAVGLMHGRRIGSIIITKEGKPFGIFTERDLLTKVLGKRGLDEKLGRVASKPLVTADAGVSAKRVASVMKSKGIKRLPLVSGGELVGMVTARDLVEAYSQA